MNELYHTDLGVRVRKLGESQMGKLVYVERIEDGKKLTLPAGELSLVLLDQDGLTMNKRRGVEKQKWKTKTSSST